MLNMNPGAGDSAEPVFMTPAACNDEITAASYAFVKPTKISIESLEL